MAKTNKVKFNLKNVYVAELIEDEAGSYSFGTPQAFPGAVSISLDPEGETTPFYADDTVYYRSTSNNGYTGDFEVALVHDWFHEKYLREIKDSKGVLVESSHITDPKYFAMMFEFAGDKHKIRHVMYKCSVSRPSIASQTKETSNTPVTETLNVTCDPLEDGLTKSRTTADTNSATYANWFKNVYIPDVTEDQMEGETDGSGSVSYARLESLSLGNLTLSPAFSATTTAYTASTSNASNAVTATGADGATVAITVNGTAHTSGDSATWNSGSNTVTVTASKSGCTPTTYTVTVTKS